MDIQGNPELSLFIKNNIPLFNQNNILKIIDVRGCDNIFYESLNLLINMPFNKKIKIMRCSNQAEDILVLNILESCPSLCVLGRSFRNWNSWYNNNINITNITL